MAYTTISGLIPGQGIVPVSNGGTGAATSSEARSNLGLDVFDSLTVGGAINGVSIALTSNVTATGAVTANSGSFNSINAANITATSTLTTQELDVTSSATIMALTVSSGMSIVGTLTLNHLTVSSAATVGSSLTANSLLVSSAATVAASLTAAKLQVSSAATISASLTANSLLVSSAATISASLTANSLLISSAASIGTSLSAVSVTATSAIEGLFVTATSTGSVNSLVVSSNATMGSSTALCDIRPVKFIRPNMPAFLAISTVSQLQATGDSTVVSPVSFGMTFYDRAASYSTTANTFTPPVPGIYSFNGCVAFDQLSSNHTAARVNVGTSLQMFTPGLTYVASAAVLGPVPLSLGWSLEAFVSTAETVWVEAQVTGSSSGVDIVGGTSQAIATWFGGHLVAG